MVPLLALRPKHSEYPGISLQRQVSLNLNARIPDRSEHEPPRRFDPERPTTVVTRVKRLPRL